MKIAKEKIFAVIMAGGKGEAILFKKGEIIKKIPEADIIDVLVSEISRL